MCPQAVTEHASNFSSFIRTFHTRFLNPYKDMQTKQTNVLRRSPSYSSLEISAISVPGSSSMGVLGNAVISKKFLRTRKIMVMHSNERGEYCLRTLVDRKKKHYDNTFDVVIRIHDQPI